MLRIYLRLPECTPIVSLIVAFVSNKTETMPLNIPFSRCWPLPAIMATETTCPSARGEEPNDERTGSLRKFNSTVDHELYVATCQPKRWWKASFQYHDYRTHILLYSPHLVVGAHSRDVS